MILALSQTALILALTATMGSLSAGWNQYPVLYRIYLAIHVFGYFI